MKAKKSLGQHFLRSNKAIASIIAAGDLKKGNTVLEIGPGEGVLTTALLESGARVIAIEKDDELSHVLKENFSSEINAGLLELRNADILETDIETFGVKKGKWKLIANIPYNITGAIIRKFLSADNQPERMVLLVQKEVAERIVGRKGKESILSISVKAYGRPRYVELVKAGSFAPMPSVDSAILAIEDISKKFFTTFSEDEFFGLLHTAFSSKRKKLSTNITMLFDRDKIGEVFRELELDDNIRPEDVSIDMWKLLAEKLFR